MLSVTPSGDIGENTVNIFEIGEDVVMCREFKEMKPPISKYTHGTVVGAYRECVRVKLPDGKLIMSHAKYWESLRDLRFKIAAQQSKGEQG